jgi:nucleotide-binding universal stress UspA family protein
MENITKKILVPVDGSKSSLKSLEYIDMIYGKKHDLDIDVFYVLPSLPPLLTDESAKDPKIYARLTAANKKNKELGEKILEEARQYLIDKDYEAEKIKIHYQKSGTSITQDIVNYAIHIKADSVLITRRGRSDLETFFMGGVSNRLVENGPDCPVWVIDGTVHSNKVLVCIDSSDNALQAVDHAAFMLADTKCRITIFHSMRHLTRFVPQEVVSEAPELEKLWSEKAGKEIAPYMKKAQQIFQEAGFSEEQIVTRVVQGTRSPANDILDEARKSGCGTIVMGQRGLTGMKRVFLGSVTRKILNDASGFSIWIV